MSKTDSTRQLIQEEINKLGELEGRLQSPINLSINLTQRLELPKLRWKNYENLPKKMKITNTGHTIILSAKWEEERPYITDGPFQAKYVFSQIHFHWGEDDLVGSEHTVDKQHFPLEMHAVHFKSTYLTQESALLEKDGITVICYLFHIQPEANPNIQNIVDSMEFVRQAHTSVRIKPFSIDSFLQHFEADYFLYWGSVTTQHCSHPILWVICRKPIGISSTQMCAFRRMTNSDNEKMIHNFRDSIPLDDRSVIHVSPSGEDEMTTLFTS